MYDHSNYSSPWTVVYDGEDGATETKDDGAGTKDDAAGAKDDAAGAKDDSKRDKNEVTFTPEQLVIIDKMETDFSEKSKRTMAELDAIKARTDLTKSQRDEMEKRFDSIQKELMTKEELFEQERKKKDKKYTEELATTQASKEKWKSRFHNASIERTIIDAATANEAFDSDTIIAILRHNTDNIESLNADGKPTGSYTPKVKFTDPEGKDGKPAELILTVPETVKRMTELPKYQYLFKGKGTGGLGANNKSGKAPDVNALAKGSPKDYRTARKNNSIKLD